MRLAFLTGLNLTIFRTFPDFWRDIFRNRRDASRGTVNIYIRRLSIMSVRYCVEMSVGYAIRMSVQVAQGDLGIFSPHYTRNSTGVVENKWITSVISPDFGTTILLYLRCQEGEKPLGKDKK